MSSCSVRVAQTMFPTFPGTKLLLHERAISAVTHMRLYIGFTSEPVVKPVG